MGRLVEPNKGLLYEVKSSVNKYLAGFCIEESHHLGERGTKRPLACFSAHTLEEPRVPKNVVWNLGCLGDGHHRSHIGWKMPQGSGCFQGTAGMGPDIFALGAR